MSAQAVAIKEDIVCSVAPVVLPPGPVTRRKLSGEDRALLERLLEQPPQFVPHPLFAERGAERELFGSRAVFCDCANPRFVAPPPIAVRKADARAIITMNTAEEQLAFKRYNYARMRCWDLLTSFRGRRLTPLATRQLVAWGQRALDTRSSIVRYNMPLVLAMAKRTRLTNVDGNELVSEGNMALLRSVEKFDCSRGFKFSTYSCRAILKSFSRVAMRLSRYRGLFPTEFDPAVEQSDFLEKKRENHRIDCVEEVKRILLGGSAGLSDVERRVIMERFAISRAAASCKKAKTLAEVGTIIGVTKERVRQIQNKALGKIRNALLEDYLAA